MKLSENFIAATNAVSTFENHIPAPYLRKEFDLDFNPQKADITICGLGFYELYVNGTNITKGYLAPYISNPEDVCYYDNYDITANLKKGKNVIGIHLGNGFRNPFGGYIWEFDNASHIGPVCTALHFEAVNGDESVEFEADESFKTHSSPVVFDEYRMGYYYDSQKELPGWSDVGFDDSTWKNAIKIITPGGVKKICTADPVVVTGELEAIEVTHYDTLPLMYDKIDFDAKPLDATVKNNVYVYDFGVNTAGVTKLTVNGQKGQKIIIHHGELCFDGKHMLNSITQHRKDIIGKYIDYIQTDVFICKGGEETFIPKFKYDGFRYAYVEGLTKEQATKNAVKLLEVHSSVRVRAGFNASDDTLNKLQEMTRRADLSNLHYIITDCPHREKNGWTGDIAASAEHLLLNLTVEKTMREWLFNASLSQDADGKIPGIVPTGGWGFNWGRGPAWDSACVNGTYYIYKYCGDTEIIKENAAMIVRNIMHFYSVRNSEGLIEFGLGDWMEPRSIKTKIFSSPKIFTNTVIVYDMAKKAKLLFERAGLIPEANYVSQIANTLRSTIREKLIDFSDMTVIGNCQTSQAMAICIGVFDDTEIRSACDKLVEIIHNDGDVSMCGILGMRYLFHALKAADNMELAYNLIVSKETTCYGSWIEQGETSLRESFTYPPPDSHNHHMFGDISSFFIQEIAGIKPNPYVDDIHNFEISPSFISQLNFANAYYDTDLGRVSFEWKRRGSDICVCALIPEGINCFLKLPKWYLFDDNTDRRHLSNGKNEFLLKYKGE